MGTTKAKIETENKKPKSKGKTSKGKEKVKGKRSSTKEVNRSDFEETQLQYKNNNNNNNNETSSIKQGSKDKTSASSSSSSKSKSEKTKTEKKKSNNSKKSKHSKTTSSKNTNENTKSNNNNNTPSNADNNKSKSNKNEKSSTKKKSIQKKTSSSSSTSPSNATSTTTNKPTANKTTSSSSSTTTSSNTTSSKRPDPPSKVVVLHPGSINLKVGLSTEATPHVVKHCYARRVADPQNKVADMDIDQNENDKTHERERENEMIQIRKNLLIKRKIISKDDNDDAVYFEMIRQITDEEKDNNNNNNNNNNENNNENNNNNNENNKNDTNDDQPIDVPFTDISSKKNTDLLFGDEAHRLDTDTHQEYELIYPIQRGYFNMSKDDLEMVTMSNDLYAIWKHILMDQLNLKKQEINDMGAFLIIPDQFDKYQVKHMVNVLFKRFSFKAIFIHQESVCAAFGAGMPTACVVDVGATKTAVNVVEDGVSAEDSRIMLPFGGTEITHALRWILKQSDFPHLDQHIPSTKCPWLSEIREQCCHLFEGEEIFQRVSFKDGNGTLVCVEIGDPLFIAPMGLFRPKLYSPLDQQPKEKSYDPEDTFDEDYLIETSGLKTTIKEKQKIIAKQEKKEIGPVVVSGIDAAVKKAIQDSGVDFTKKKNTTDNNQVPILLCGGCTLMKGFPEMLQGKLKKVLRKDKLKPCVIPGVSKDEAQSCDGLSLSWKGGTLIAHLDSAKDMWVFRDEYMTDGMRVVKERAPFVL